MKWILAQESPNNCYGSYNQKKNNSKDNGIDQSTKEKSKSKPSQIKRAQNRRTPQDNKKKTNGKYQKNPPFSMTSWYQPQP